MNYEERMNLQKKLKDFSYDELIELQDCVLYKEIKERDVIKEQNMLNLLYN